MKKIFVIAIGLSASTFTFAQNNLQEANEMSTKIIHDLSLNAEQAQRVSEIYTNIGMKNEAVLSDPSTTEQFRKDALKGNTEAGQYLVNEVLTPEQRTMWEQSKQPKRTELKESPVKMKSVPAPKTN
jgi:Spy/CpxP family protein refolding chaperone